MSDTDYSVKREKDIKIPPPHLRHTLLKVVFEGDAQLASTTYYNVS